MKERKLVLKKGREEASPQKVLQSIWEQLEKDYPNADIKIFDCSHACYIDTYYDTADRELRKNGESLKLRRGSDLGGRNVSMAIMRRATKYPQKREVSPWDEAEASLKKLNLETAKSAMKSFFDEFDFDKLEPEPVLICNTHRTAFRVRISHNGCEEMCFSIYFDNIRYSRGLLEKQDTIIKINAKFGVPEVVEHVFKKLEEKYQQYEMIYMSRYERALEVLKN